MDIRSLDELIKRAKDAGVTLGKAAMLMQREQDGADEAGMRARMGEALGVMRASIESGMNPDTKSMSGLTGGQAAKLMALAKSGRAAGGETLASAGARALAVAEFNAAMGRIVAAPTAGACGILPAALSSAAERFGFDDDSLIDALFCAAGVGAVIARRASISGAEGGCQAECGSAAAMAAAALTQLMGGDGVTCAKAAGFALMNLMGLACDPVKGLVEIPCVYRNVIGVAAAFTSADLALAGAALPLSPDDIIDAMGRVGRSMPRELRETGLGGCASCKVCEPL